MIALGAHVRIVSGRYSVGFAWIDDLRLIDTDVFPAPADREEPGQLGELHGRVYDVIGEVRPELFVLKPSEIMRATGNAVAAHRAEGIVLGAASRRADLEIECRTRQRLFTPAGLTQSATGPQVVDTLCARLDSEPADGECRQAAAAAVGALIARGVV